MSAVIHRRLKHLVLKLYDRPTVILTPMSAEYWSGERGDNFLKQIPIGRFGYEDEAAACFLYLASDAANLITGENLVIDGGFTVV